MPTTAIASLTEHECRELLDTVTVGRLLFTQRALPAIQPVRFATTDGHILLPVEEGSWADKLHDVLVAFAADDIGPGTYTGRSVLVHGTARLVNRPNRQLRLTIERITGQRVTLTGPHTCAHLAAHESSSCSTRSKAHRASGR